MKTRIILSAVLIIGLLWTSGPCGQEEAVRDICRRELENHVDELAKEVVVEFPGPDGYVLDGDVYGCRTVTVTAGPQLAIVSPG